MMLTRALPSLSPRDRRTLSHGGLAISLVLVVGKGLPAYRTWTHNARMAAAEVSAGAASADRLMARMPTTRDLLRTRSARLHALEPLVLAGDTPATAAAALASLVADAATDAGVTLGAIQPRADAGVGVGAVSGAAPLRHAFVRVSVHGELTGDVVGLGQFLGDLERGPTLLSIRNLAVSQPDPAAPSDHMETLHAEFTVMGLALAPTRTSSDRASALRVPQS